MISAFVKYAEDDQERPLERLLKDKGGIPMRNTKRKAACAAVLCMAMATPFSALADEIRVITCGTLNLRAEANTNSSILGKYGWGTQVNVKTIENGWASVEVGGQSGYMYAQYLGTPGSTDYTAYVRTNSRGLNLRETPNGTILTSFPRGTKVTVHSTEGGWSKVTVNGMSGYMSSQWLSTSKPSDGGSSGGSGGGTIITGTAVVNNPSDTQVLFLRSKPSTSSTALGYYRNGKVVTLLEKLDGWYKVSVDGKTGYMMAKYLRVSSSVTGGTATVYNPNGNSYVNFRWRPSLSSGVIRTIPVGTTIKVLEKTTDWTKTEIDGVTGYISTWFLKF